MMQLRRYLRSAERRLRTTVVQPIRALELRFSRFAPPYRLHLGCGDVHLDGWVNIDAAKSPAADLQCDLRRGLPVPSASCRLIYSEHLLEHFTIEDGLRLLRECHRVLMPGGRLRVAMPSLDDLIAQSYRGDWREQDWLTWPEYRHIRTRAEMLNISFRSWGHQWLYDREELHRRLGEAGWTRVLDVEVGASDEPELRGRETRKDSRLVCEAVK